MPAVPVPLAPGRVECRVLGPLEVRAGGWPLPLGGRKQRLVLATLLLAGGRPVSADRLVDVLWGDDAPSTARNTLQAHVSGLRRALGQAGAPAVVRRDPGYAVDLAGADLDLARFRGAVEEGRTALREGRPDAAVPALDTALQLWAGPPLADLADEPGLAAELRALEEDRLAAVASRAEAHLALGPSVSLVAELTELVAEHPLHEHLRALLVRGLYRAGRAADALGVLRAGRRVLAEELGADPGAELRDLERAVLDAEDLRGLERESMPFLLHQDATGAQRAEPLDPARSPVTIGRAPENPVALVWDREVSRVHARLEWSRLGWVLVDVSRNGSLVDGVLVRGGRRLLRDGAVLRIGETVLLFRSAVSARPATAPETALATAEAPVRLLAGLSPEEQDVLATVLAVPAGGFTGGRPEELLAEALGLPVERVIAVVPVLCRRFGAPDGGPGRVPALAERARVLGLASA
ncbi:BTAD domain-containing putative transcriptional regulator [Blastococcus sp. URHD0036]|uniref:BTAD domain-containing putative transcriptional regulator n=1 Tax=Blastococcus sp. URHD0036 TaxID=1380356 RepID=UPI0018CC36A0|nr:BTAD domain-containing putative transcriptional regulator [Blastococcus sp. URHD0036]